MYIQYLFKTLIEKLQVESYKLSSFSSDLGIANLRHRQRSLVRAAAAVVCPALPGLD